MAMWVFGYGSLIWKAGFRYDDRLVGFIKDYRRVFYQGSTDHRGTPEFPGRTVTLEPAKGEVCWGVAYKIIHKEDQEAALEESSVSTPAVSSVMVQILKAEGPSGPNRDYLFKLENVLVQIGCEDNHVNDLADEVRRILHTRGLQ